ncbi:DUF2130 domain-containing protein [Mycoplasma yeatsii]|uniref:DUF2130 domain-containing protein n=1 Tax=Mycoplasma yeatsii TaxID=51365 RepID=UPI0005B248BD|nr:DUF2130 domain-containing protein [Mycoplasma yeatsii]AJM72063.1 hypothetical protein MYE_03075 [Mycoplasma yeatsii GM274B]
MSNIKFKIIDKNTIELLEDAKKGDMIDLSNAEQIDLSNIQQQIVDHKDQLYLEKLNKEKEKWQLESNIEFEKYKNQLNKENEEQFKENTKLKQENQNLSQTIEKQVLDFEKQLNDNKTIWQSNTDTQLANLKTKLLEEKQQEFEQITKDKLKLESDIDSLNKQLANQEKLIKLEAENNYQNQLNKQKEELNNKINELKESLKDKENSLNTIDLNYKNQINEITNNKQNEINNLIKDLEIIKREKLTKNIKLIGEELENYCFNQFNEISTFAFKTSTLIKDNQVVKSDDDLKGTKGDFIFKVYAEEEKQNLLLSVMCEMKSEQLNSQNKKKNSDHYKKLDDDRNKKNLDYALLVSELEYETNDSLIYRVSDYKNMFVVRPMYFITMLGVLETIALKYKDLKLNRLQQELSFKEKQDILDEFEEFKNNLLDNALTNIDNKAKEIYKSAENIKNEATKIIKNVDIIVDRHLNTVKNKINGFKINKVVEKIGEINNGI